MDYEHVTIETPEHVSISYELAGPGSRMVASLLDHLILYLLMAAIFLGALAVGIHTDLAKLPMVAILLIVGGFFLFHILYFGLFEVLWDGQTPGKRAAGIRVMRDDGTPASTMDIITRNAVRLIDYMPYLYFVGGVASFAHRQSKRLGDMAAGTVVVRVREGSLPIEIPVTAVPTRAAEPTSAIPEDLAQLLAPSVSRITREEYGAIRRFLGRRFELAPGVRHQMAFRILSVVLPKLSPEGQARGQQNPEGVLEALHELGMRADRAT